MMNWAICTLAFFGFFRLGKILLTTTNFDPEHHLAVGGIAVDSQQNPSLLKVHLKCSKQSSYEKGSISTLGRPGTIFAQSPLYYPSLPFEDKGQARFPSVAIALHIQWGTSYQNFGQRCRQLGWLAQTLQDIASALELQPLRCRAAMIWLNFISCHVIFLLWYDDMSWLKVHFQNFCLTAWKKS